MISLAQVFHRSSGSSLPGRPDGLGALVPCHGFPQGAIYLRAQSHPTPTQLRLGAPLPHNPRIVCVFVRVAQPIGHVERLGYDAGEVFFKLFRQRQQQIHQRIVVVRLDLERIEADARGLGRLVEEPIPLGLRDRAPHGLRREGLERKFHGGLPDGPAHAG